MGCVHAVPAVLRRLESLNDMVGPAARDPGRPFFAPGCADLGSAARTFAFWEPGPGLPGLGETSRSAPQNPSAP
jgi:hypothetical protein